MPNKSALRRLWRDEGGATAVELGIILLMIAAAAMGSMEVLGGTISGFFADTGTRMENVNPAVGN